MKLREAQPTDKAAIVDLLRLSLGDGSSEKSERYWNWKHVDNPFGPSPVLLAESDDGRLVGVRAFMQWRWTDGRREYRALRAVDTATHPDFRGRGIFKKLTLELIRRRTEAGDDFIFNTPNDQSRPGYLKMGWRELGRLPVCLYPHRPFAMALRKLKVRDLEINPDRVRSSHKRFDWTASYGNGTREAGKGWSRADRADYLGWRYRDCPVVDYLVVGQPERYLIVVHPKASPLGLEFRLVDFWAADDPAPRREAAERFQELLREWRPHFCSVAPGQRPTTGWWLRGKFGPVTTYRELSFDDPPALPDWQYALGDMELF